MFNIGFLEWIFLIALVILVIGPKQLPKVAQVVGQSFNELKRIMDSISIHSIHDEDLYKTSSQHKKLPKQSNQKDSTHNPKKSSPS